MFVEALLSQALQQPGTGQNQHQFYPPQQAQPAYLQQPLRATQPPPQYMPPQPQPLIHQLRPLSASTQAQASYQSQFYPQPQFFPQAQLHAQHQHQPLSNHHEKIFDPDWQQAENHRQASKVGFPSSSNSPNRQICWCCLQQVNKQQIPLDQNTKQLQFLGFGFPLYYSFVRNCIFLLLVTICAYNIMAIHRSVRHNYQICHRDSARALDESKKVGGHGGKHYYEFNQVHFYGDRMFQHESETAGATKLSQKEQQKQIYCSSWMIDLARVQKKVTFDELLIRGISFAIHLILLIYIRDKLTKLKEYFDQRTASPSDYALMIKNLPGKEGFNLRNDITRKLGQQLGNDKIEEIILIPDLHRHEELEEEKLHTIDKLRKATKEDNQVQIKNLTHEYEKIQHQIQAFVKRHQVLDKQNQMAAERGIIIMQTEQDKDAILDAYKDDGFRSESWSKVIVSQAPEPRQIIWQNIALSTSKKNSLLAMGWGLSILVLVILTVLFAIISKRKSLKVQHEMQSYRHTHQSPPHIRAIAIVILMITFVVLLNKLVISNLFHKFTDMQRHSTTYKFQFSFCLKYCLGLFFTTALMTLIVEAFMMGNYYQHDFGVVEQQTIMYIVNSIFVPLFWALHPIYLYKKYKASRNYGHKEWTQAQANKMLEYPQYDVGKRYGQVLQIVWFTFLYMTLIPIGGFFSCVGLGLYYWIDKYNLLRRSSVRSYVSGELIHLTLQMLDFSLVLRVVGEIIFDYQIRDGAKALSWVCLAIALLYQVLPIQSLIMYINHQKFNSEQMTYQQAKSRFTSSYYDQHVLFSVVKEDRQMLMKDTMSKLVSSLVGSGGPGKMMMAQQQVKA